MDTAVFEDRASTPSCTGSEACRGPSRSETEIAVRASIEWAGDDADREGLKGRPVYVDGKLQTRRRSKPVEEGDRFSTEIPF